MKKSLINNGFTLIEMLGIVVILTVILLVAVPAMTSSLRNSNTKRYENFMKNLVLVTESYLVNEKLTSSLNECVTLQALLEEHYIEEIPAFAEQDPFGPETQLLGTDQICASKTSVNTEYKYKICRGSTCKAL